MAPEKSVVKRANIFKRDFSDANKLAQTGVKPFTGHR